MQVAACRQELDVAQYNEVDEKYRVQVQPIVLPYNTSTLPYLG